MKKSVFFGFVLCSIITLWFISTAAAQPGSNDPTFAVGIGASAIVDDLLVLPDGSVIYAGGFSHLNQVQAPYLVKLKSDGSIDGSFQYDAVSSATLRVTIVTNQGDSLLIVGISNVNSQFAYTLSRLTENGTHDATFPQHVFDQPISDVHVMLDGSILVTGYFSTMNGSGTASTVLLDKNGNRITNDPFPDIGYFQAKSLDNGDFIISSLSFDNEFFRAQLKKINSTGTYYQNFTVELRGSVNVIEELPNGITLIGGDFDQVNGNDQLCLIAVDADGNLVQDFNAGFESGCDVSDILYLHENQILVSGTFDSYKGQDYSGIVQIRSDASLVASFKTPDDLNVVRRVELYDDDRVNIFGNFESIDGNRQQYIARLVINSVSTSDVDDFEYIPSTFSIEPNFPNPFNPTTNIRIDLPVAAGVSVTVYDIMGRVVMQLPASSLNAGRHTMTLDASRLGSGVYLYKVVAGKYQGSGKMTVFK